MGLANQITIARGGVTVALWILLVIGTRAPSPTIWITSFILFSVAAVTDMLDGAVARSRKEVTVFGRIVDPLVDKLLTIGTLILLLGVPEARAVLPPWAVVVMLVRELLITTLRSAAESRGLNFQAVAIGK